MLAAIALKLVLGLVHAKDLSALDRQFAAMHTSDVAVVAVYRKRRLALHPTFDEETGYFDSLPSTQAELDAIYQGLTHDRAISEDPMVSDVVYGMHEAAAAIVRKHHTGHQKFIRLVLFANAEVGEIAWPEYDTLLEAEPELMIAALRSLTKEERTRICHGHDPRQLTQRETFAQCESDL